MFALFVKNKLTFYCCSRLGCIFKCLQEIEGRVRLFSRCLYIIRFLPLGLFGFIAFDIFVFVWGNVIDCSRFEAKQSYDFRFKVVGFFLPAYNFGITFSTITCLSFFDCHGFFSFFNLFCALLMNDTRRMSFTYE